MSKSKKWEHISDILRGQILSGELKPGNEFPTNVELMKIFDVHAGTIQQAVNDLIARGLVITHGGNNRRTVYKPPERSYRSCGFLSDAGKRGQQELLELRVLNNPDELPKDVLDQLPLPVVLYKTRQWRDDIPVAISESYLPLFNSKFIDELDATKELYKLMEKHGFKPIKCRESLVTSLPSAEEQDLLQLPRSSYWPVTRIKRLVYDESGKLLEYCFLTDRSDCYEFIYEFSIQP